VGSTFASTCPTLTCSPSETSSEHSVPLVAKPALAELATPTFPEALTLDWTIPRVTVAVRCEPVLDEELSRKP